MHLVHLGNPPSQAHRQVAPMLAVLLDGAVVAVTNPEQPGVHVDLFQTPLAALREWCCHAVDHGERVPLADVELSPAPTRLIWAAGLSYKTGGDAGSEIVGRAEGSAKVYEASRPEIFIKYAAAPASDGEDITVRSDSSWNVPEAELTLVINNQREVVAYAAGNDVSARSILGESPLYLQQAKVWNGSASLGNVFRLNTADFDASDVDIHLTVTRGGEVAFQGSTNTNQLARPLDDLAAWLHRGQEFPDGVYFMTGTGIVMTKDFTLVQGDEITITIAGIGTLTNRVKVLDVETNAIVQR